jgi:hypothetical protein
LVQISSVGNLPTPLEFDNRGLRTSHRNIKFKASSRCSGCHTFHCLLTVSENHSSYTLEYNRNPPSTSHLWNRHYWGSAGTRAPLFTLGGVSFMPLKNRACYPMMSPQQSTTTRHNKIQRTIRTVHTQQEFPREVTAPFTG